MVLEYGGCEEVASFPGVFGGGGTGTPLEGIFVVVEPGVLSAFSCSFYPVARGGGNALCIVRRPDGRTEVGEDLKCFPVLRVAQFAHRYLRGVAFVKAPSLGRRSGFRRGLPGFFLGPG